MWPCYGATHREQDAADFRAISDASHAAPGATASLTASHAYVEMGRVRPDVAVEGREDRRATVP